MKAEKIAEIEGVLFTVQGIADVEPGLNYGGVRSDVTLRDYNGLAESGAVIRRGRRILIHRPRYLTWLMDKGRREALR